MNEPWRFIWLSDAAIVYAVNVLMAASVACAAGLAADVALRRRFLPLRHGVLQAALVAAVGLRKPPPVVLSRAVPTPLVHAVGGRRSARVPGNRRRPAIRRPCPP